MGRRETGLLERLFNYMTGTGTTVTRTSDFWGNKKTMPSLTGMIVLFHPANSHMVLL